MPFRAIVAVYVLIFWSAVAVSFASIGTAVLKDRAASKLRRSIPYVRPLEPFVDIMIDEVQRPQCPAWKTVYPNGVEERCV